MDISSKVTGDWVAFEDDGRNTHAVELATEVDGVDVVAFQIREHDDLDGM